MKKKAKILIDVILNFTEVNLKGEEFNITEIVGNRVTLDVNGRKVDFLKRELKISATQDNEQIGQSLIVFRNQGDREAVIIAQHEDTFLIEYEMPRGTTALNIINEHDEEYKKITYLKAKNSKIWGKKIDSELLINNPQSGERF